MRALSILVIVVGCGRLGFDPGAGTGTGSGTDPDANPGGSDPDSTLGNGLVGWWRFDEGSGATVADSSGHGNSAMLAGPSSWRTGVIGGAIQLTSNGRLELAATNGFPTTGSFTVAAWTMPSQTGPGAIMSVDSRMSTPWTQAWTLRIVNCGGGVDLFVAKDAMAGGGRLCGLTPIPVGAWHHIVGVYDASGPRMDVYFDGQRDTDAYEFGTPPPNRFYDPSYGGNIGEMSVNFRFQGSLDDMRVYDRALSDADIAALFAAR